MRRTARSERRQQVLNSILIILGSFFPSKPLFSEQTDLDLAIKYSPKKELTDEFVKYRCDYMSKRLKLLKREGLGSTSDGVEYCEKVRAN